MAGWAVPGHIEASFGHLGTRRVLPIYTVFTVSAGLTLFTGARVIAFVDVLGDLASASSTGQLVTDHVCGAGLARGVAWVEILR